jgi:beta-N-acetylhexosaminidase
MSLRKLRLIFLLLISFVQPIQAQDTNIEMTIASMSLEQKVSQMFVMSFFGSVLTEPATELLTTWQPGAVVFLPSNLENPAQITRLTNDIQQTLIDSGGFPAFITLDQEGGIISRLKEGFTRWPVAGLLTATQNPELAYQFGMALAEEMRAVGLNMNLAPVADLQTNPDNIVIGRRSYGSEPEMVAPIIASIIQGMQDNNVLATVKHFPGHGNTNADPHLELPTVSYSQEELLNRELIPFASAIDVGVAAVMVAHINFPNIDGDTETPASLSRNIVTGLLRGELGFQGLAITDALDMDAIDTVYSPSEAAIRAIRAGNDLILIGAHIGTQTQANAMQTVVDTVRNGEISESRIDESVRRILLAKEQFGILNWQSLDPNTAETRINREEHETLIYNMFDEGITLVQDNENLLPLSGRVVMIYPGARFSLWAACQANNWQPVGISQFPSDEEIQGAYQSSISADRIVVFTQDIENNVQQQNLLRLLPPEKTVVVALATPYDLYSLPDISTYLVTYSSLPESHRTICDILNGRQEAQGQLSLSLD